MFLDLLGFSDRVESENPNQIFKLIDEVLQDFTRWENLNNAFRTIHLSDSFTFLGTIGLRRLGFFGCIRIRWVVFCSMLAKGIPAREAISFGDFQVKRQHEQTPGVLREGADRSIQGFQ